MAVVIVPPLEGVCFSSIAVLEQCQLSLRNRYFQAYIQIASRAACGQGTPTLPAVCRAHGRAVPKVPPVPCTAPSQNFSLLRSMGAPDHGCPGTGASPRGARLEPWLGGISPAVVPFLSAHPRLSCGRQWGEGDPTSCQDTLFAALAAAPGGFLLSPARGSGVRVPGGVRAAVCLAASPPVTVRLIIAERKKGIKCSH